ncbi:MAG: hypothetical protein ABIL25_09170 [candidate division WOR-3 bacterium]
MTDAIGMERNWCGENCVASKVIPPWSRVSYVGAVTSVFRTRDVKCDFVDVAGMSGYAFVVNLDEQLSPGGPTGFHWTMLQDGTEAIGLETEIVLAEYHRETDDEVLAADLFERVRQEIDEGRCCVVWGATSAPEFAVVYGYRNDCYLVRSLRSVQCVADRDLAQALGPDEWPEDPVQYNALQAPRHLGAVFFGTAIETDRSSAEREAVVRAVQLVLDRHPCFEPGFRHGARAFEAWAEALRAGWMEPQGNAYNIACFCELQMFAASFCRRLAETHVRAAEQLGQAAREFARSYLNLEHLKKLFPLSVGGNPDKEAIRAEAATLLHECCMHNEQAGAALERALALF